MGGKVQTQKGALDQQRLSFFLCNHLFFHNHGTDEKWFRGEVLHPIITTVVKSVAITFPLSPTPVHYKAHTLCSLFIYTLPPALHGEYLQRAASLFY